jgi:hypothetical protein
MKMYLGGQWVSRDSVQEVFNPFDGSVLDTVPKGSTNDVEDGVKSAERGFIEMKTLTALLTPSSTSLVLPLGTVSRTEPSKGLKTSCTESLETHWPPKYIFIIFSSKFR